MARRFTDRAAFDGETLTGTFAAPAGTTAVDVLLSDGRTSATVAATKNADGTWTATAPAEALKGLSGAVNWRALAAAPDGTEVVAAGSIYVRPLVSRYRADLEAVERAIAAWAANPNQSVTCGELGVTYKTLDGLLAARSTLRALVAADEGGAPQPGGVRVVKVRFG